MEVLNAIRGISFTLPTLYQQIAENGWQVKKVAYDPKRDKYVATAKAPHGEELEGWGPTDRIAVSNLLYRVMHVNGLRVSKVSMWTHTFTEQLSAIAEAYSKAPLYEPKAAAAFLELGRDSQRRADALREHLEIIITNKPEPYTDVEKMSDDVRKRRKLEVSRAGVDHPIWSEDQVIAYRIVHDVLGHCAVEAGFDWEGENQAFAAHAAIIPVEAQKALFTESIASTAYATYYRSYGPQKVALFPEFMDPAQEAENPHDGYRGIHPTQVFPPIPRPRVKPLAAFRGPGGLDPIIRLEGAEKRSQSLTDPNEQWMSQSAPQIQALPLNANHDHGDPLQAQAVMDNASLIDTEWAYLDQNDPQDVARMRQAVTNAFRAVLLSPRKDLRWNTIHYQDIADIPATEDDPTTYWRRLEKRRQEWNVQRHGEDARFAHMPYYAQWKALENLMYQRDPSAGWPAAVKEAETFLMRMQTRVQDDVEAEDADKPEDKQRHMYQIELETNKRLTKMLKNYIAEHQLSLDMTAAVKPTGDAVVAPPKEKLLKQPYQGPVDTMFDDTPVVDLPDKSKYGAWMGTHLQAISQISQHVDEILKAALFDVHERDGTGHHFRASVLRLGVPGVGPKVCSFAWLILQPMTSQLATIDTHMMDVLGHNYEGDMNNRDYFKFERELAAGRNASGYSHVPLGAFQWGMWDYKRTGPGSHQDHSALRALDPLPYQSVNWQDKAQNLKGGNWPAPDWWQATQVARDSVSNDWDQNVAPYYNASAVPFQENAVLSKQAASMLVPTFKHPTTGEMIAGQPGQTLMSHLTQSLGLSTPEVWQKIPDEYVSKG